MYLLRWQPASWVSSVPPTPVSSTSEEQTHSIWEVSCCCPAALSSERLRPTPPLGSSWLLLWCLGFRRQIKKFPRIWEKLLREAQLRSLSARTTLKFRNIILSQTADAYQREWNQQQAQMLSFPSCKSSGLSLIIHHLCLEARFTFVNESVHF